MLAKGLRQSPGPSKSPTNVLLIFLVSAFLLSNITFSRLGCITSLSLFVYSSPQWSTQDWREFLWDAETGVFWEVTEAEMLH